MKVWFLLLLFCSCNYLPMYMLSLFILFVLRFSSGPSFPWARIGGTMVREKHRPTFSHWHDDDSLYWARHWKPRYVMWRWRRWRPNRPNLPLFPARDQNTWFSKGRIPPFSPPFCATLFCAIQSSLLEITRYRSIWNGFSWNWDGQFYLILFILFNGAATVASLRHDIHKKKMSDN